jgi:serine/threonine protein kinase
VQLQAKLDHYHIVYLYEVSTLHQIIEVSGNFCFIQEFCPNGNLHGYIESHPLLSDQSAGKLFWQLMSAVDYLHCLGVSHLGIKPANILFDDKFDLKLTNFSTAVKQTEMTDQLTDTYSDMANTAPEMLLTGCYHGKQADVWSCGLLLYFILTKTSPFVDLTEAEMKDRIINADILYPKYLSENAKKLIKSMLATAPEARPTSEQILCHPWMVENCPQGYPMDMKRTEINEAALLKMSSNFKVDKKFHHTMIDSLMENQKNWLTAK